MSIALQTSTYELERGKPMPSKNHGIVQGNIYFELRKKYGEQYSPITEPSLDIQGKERIPDVALFQQLEYTPGADEVRISEIPLLAVEILSPKQHLSELLLKAIPYFEQGIRSYWLVLPDLKTVYVFSAANEYEVFAKTDILKDETLSLALNLKDIFR